MKRKSPKYYAEQDPFLKNGFAVYRQYRWRRKAIWLFDNMADAERLAQRLEEAK